MVSDAERSKWVAWFKRNGEEHVVLTDARSGKGVKRVAEVALLVSKSVNDKRRAKGLMPRPVRTAVIGYPNVGYSNFELPCPQNWTDYGNGAWRQNTGADCSWPMFKIDVETRTQGEDCD